MATIKVTSTTGVDLSAYVEPDTSGGVKTHTPTKWHLDYAGGKSDDFSGTKLTYTATTFDLVTGTLTGLTHVESKTDKFVIAGISVDVAADFVGETGQDFLKAALKGNDTITGGNGNDTLLGFDGDDTIDGGKGNDTLVGGDGNDTYIIDSLDDKVTELDKEGTDTVKTSALITDTTNFAFVENFTYTGKLAWTFLGNDLDNTIIGGAAIDDLNGGKGDDVLDGGKGNDKFNGGADGDDTFIVDNLAEFGNITDGAGVNTLVSSALFTQADLAKLTAAIDNFTYTGKSNFELSFAGDDTVHVLTGGGGLDKLTGGDLDDTLIGNAGNDTLDGGLGKDTMNGGAGNDTYIIDDAGDKVQGEDNAKNGIDTVKTTINLNLSAGAFVGQLIENVTLQGGATQATGNDLNNVLDGSAIAGDGVLAGGKGNDTLLGGTSDDVLDGGAGNDTMTGGDGSDVYVVDSAGDKVIEKGAGADTDRIDSSITFSLAKFGSIEDLTLTGTADINATGNTLDNVITGNDGNNILDGGAGKDTLAGGLGDDTYLFDADDNPIQEDANGGIDTVKTGVAFNDAIANVENYIFTGKGDWVFDGNELDNQITGGAGNDNLFGDDGDDIITGGAGNDTLEGRHGDDIMDGGKGNDLYEINTDDGRDALLPGTYNTGDKIDLAGSDFYDINFSWDYDALYLAAAIDGNYDFHDTNTLVLWDFFAGGKGSITVTIDTQNYNLDYGTDPDLATFTFQQGLTGTNNANSAEIIIGGDSNDKIDGKGGFYDSLFGGDGDDVITGGGGTDWERGGRGNDTLNGLAGNDTLRGGDGYDVVNGGDGTDRADFREGGSHQPFANAWVDLTINRAINDGFNTGDVLSSIENLSGTNQSDLLTGDGQDNFLQGRDGDDTLAGGGGNDGMRGDGGSDIFLFGALGEGDDFITDFDTTDDTLAFNKTLDTNKNGIIDELKAAVDDVTDDGNDVLIAFKVGGTIRLEGIGDGTITDVDKLDAAINIVTVDTAHVVAGDGGEDVVGTDGDDVLVGGKGNDSFEGGLGNDAMLGGAGNDTYNFNIGDGNDVLLPGTYNTGDVINLLGTDNYDINFGWDGTNLFLAQAKDGNYDFNDTGQITLQNFLNGGKGSIAVTIDTATYNGDYGTDPALATFIFQQGLTGTNNTNTSEVLIGGAKNDTINGNGGFYDQLFGNDGDDKLTGGSGIDRLYGGNGNDTLLGLGGDDSLRGEAGFDTIDGGDGKDRIDYRNTDSGVWVDLSINRTINDGYVKNGFSVGASDILKNFEDARGSDHDDLLVGDANANKLVGRDGDDTLVGSGGNDTLQGDGGADLFVIGSFAEGTDTITDFDAKNDTLAFADTLDEGAAGMDDDFTAAGLVITDVAGDVTLTFAAGGSVVIKGIGTGSIDTLAELKAAIGIDTIVLGTHQTGDKNGNTLIGNDGHDVLAGGAGNDTLVGGIGGDSLDGGAGNDTFVFNIGDGFDVMAPGTYNAGDVIQLAGSDFYDLNFDWDQNRNLHVAQAIDSDYDFNDTGSVTLQGFLATTKNTISLTIDTENYNLLYGTDADLAHFTLTSSLTGSKNANSTEVIFGQLGNDTINGNGGFYDMIFGDSGDDTINGGSGRDFLFGQWGEDILNGAAGDDTLRGGDASDILNGGDGEDRADYKDSDHGVIVNLAIGLTSDDGNGQDFVYQDKLNSIEDVRGSKHDDTIKGDGGANKIEALAGNDTVTGGAGADTFQFNTFGEGDDTITDFDFDHDIIAFSKSLDVGGAAGILDELQAAITNVDDQGNGDDVVITFTNGDTLTFKGVGTGTINDITDLVDDPNTQIVGF